MDTEFIMLDRPTSSLIIPVNAGADAIGLSNGENYKVTNIDELVGVVIENNGGQDYFGNTVNSTLIGAIK